MENTENTANMPLITVEESGKDWSIVGTESVTNWEDFFMDAHNFKGVLDFAKVRARGLVADPTTKDGQVTRKALAKRIGQVEKAIADKGLEVARILKEKPKKIDAVRKTVKDTLLMYKEEVLAPLKEIEARLAEIAEISNLPAMGVGCDSEALKDLLERLDGYKSKDWKESAAEAEDTINEARRQLTDMLARQEKEEADARELEELRKQKEALAIAEKEKAEAELRKAREAAAKAEAEKKAAEAEAEKARKEAEEAKRQAEASAARPDTGHEWTPKADPTDQLLFPDGEKGRQREIKTKVKKALMEIIGNKLQGFSESGYELAAKAIVMAVAKGKIPHLVLDFRF